MKVTFAAGQPPIFEFEAGSPKEIFEKIALVQGLFNESKCGCCDSAHITYVKREIDNGCYLELRCNDCSAKLDFGQNKDGKGIFVKNWDKDNRRPMPNRGWYVYQKTGESAPRQQADPSTAPPAGRAPEDIPF